MAATVLLRVEKDSAYAAAALDAELLRAAQLGPRDRGLCTEIVYGVLRTRGALEAELEKFVSTGLKHTDPSTRIHLLVGAYQILFLDRVPTHAAVDAAVTEVRGHRGPKVAGFVNAVLRKLGSAETKLRLGEAIVAAAPSWLWQRLVDAVGKGEAAALLGVAGSPPTASLRLLRGRPVPEWIAELAASPLSGHARRVQGAGDLRAKSGYDEGAYVIQEEGAQIVGLSLGAQPGDRVLDACAGRGQKTSLLAEQVGPEGELWAADLHPHKLRALSEEFSRLGLTQPKAVAVDWTRGSGRVPEDYFDRVLVDAPCTGTGTLRRRPEIASRLSPVDPARLAELAEQILRRAATRAKPGGRVVFAVCSVLPEEGQQMSARVDDILRPEPFDSADAQSVAGSDASAMHLLPERHGTEGYFIASFRRR